MNNSRQFYKTYSTHTAMRSVMPQMPLKCRHSHLVYSFSKNKDTLIKFSTSFAFGEILLLYKTYSTRRAMRSVMPQVLLKCLHPHLVYSLCKSKGALVKIPTNFLCDEHRYQDRHTILK